MLLDKLKPFDEDDWMTFSGCSSDYPVIAYLTDNDVEMVRRVYDIFCI